MKIIFRFKICVNVRPSLVWTYALGMLMCCTMSSVACRDECALVPNTAKLCNTAGGELSKSWTQVLNKDKFFLFCPPTVDECVRVNSGSARRPLARPSCTFSANSFSILRVLHLIIDHFRCRKATSHLPSTRRRCQPGWPSSRPLPLRPGAASRGLHGFCSKLRGQSLMLGCCSSLHDLAGAFSGALAGWQGVDNTGRDREGRRWQAA